MLLPIKPICPKSKARKDGTALIFLQYCGTEKSTLLNTEIAIPPKYWHRKHLRILSDLPEEFGIADTLNEEVEKQLRLANDIVSYAIKKNIPDVVTFAKETYHPGFDPVTLEEKAISVEETNPKSNLDLYFQIDEYIKCKKKKVSKATIGIYNSMKAQLKAFEDYRGKPISFDSLDYDFYENFVEFLTYEFIQTRFKKQVKGLRLNSIGKTIKQLRVFVKDRVKRKIIQPIDLSDFKILDEEADAIYLTWEEIKQIYQTDLSEHLHLIIYRDLFVLGCLTGLRFSDFSTIQPEDIRNKTLYKKQDKSDHWVVIPLQNVAVEILIDRFDKQIPKVSNSEFNQYIKDVAHLAGICQIIQFSYKKGNKDIVQVKPKYAWVTSHTCRRSFCTNEFLAGTPVELIMKISGHKSLRDFYKYIKITPEEASRKIREIWEKRDNIDWAGSAA